MPTDMSKYPANWQEIRHNILLRAGGRLPDPRIGARCELCNLRNYTVGIRFEDGSFVHKVNEYNSSYKIAREVADYYTQKYDIKHIVIVLTIAHIHDPNPMNCSPDNLKALCQHCHNVRDAKMRHRNRKTRELQEKIDGGQLPLPI